MAKAKAKKKVVKKAKVASIDTGKNELGESYLDESSDKVTK